MARQSLTWTALPNGYTADGSGIRLSVLLSPRLDTQDPTVTHKKLSVFFPDWEDWPKTLSNAKFDVTYNGQTVSIPATTVAGANRVDNRLGLADSAVWKALFTKDLLVKTLRVQRPVAVGDAVLRRRHDGGRRSRTLYRDLARTATDRLPRVSEIIETERWRDFINAVDDLDEPVGRSPHGLARSAQAVRRAPPPGHASAPVSACSPGSCCFTRRRRRRCRAGRRRKDDDRIEATWLEHKRVDLPKREDIAAGARVPSGRRGHGVVSHAAAAPRPRRRSDPGARPVHAGRGRGPRRASRVRAGRAAGSADDSMRAR